MQNSPKPRRRGLVLLSAFVAGMVVVVGAALVVTATDQAVFCANCHAMGEAAWTHKQSVHAQFNCNECHTPHSIPAKLPYKAKVGLHDIYVTLTNQAPDMIHATGEMKDVIQANCRRCHISTVQNVAMDSKPYCTDCHRAVPHSKKIPIDRRKAADV